MSFERIGMNASEIWLTLLISIICWLPVRYHLNVIIRKLFRQLWPATLKRLESMTYTGIFTDKFSSEADVVIDWSETIVHHSVGGLFMIVGMITNNTRIFTWGAMSEAGGEIVDYLKLQFRVWPYDRRPVMLRSRAILAMHHIPSIVLTLANSMYCSALIHYQVISLSLEGGGAASALFIVLSPCVIQSRRRTIILHVAHLAFFIWCRFIVYMPASRAACTFQCDPANNIPHWVCIANVSGAVMFAIFNVLGLADFLQGLYRAMVAPTPAPTGSAPTAATSTGAATSNEHAD